MGYHFFFAKNERNTSIPTINRDTVEPIRLFGLRINPINIKLKARNARIVVNGNHLTLKDGRVLYCGRSFKCAAQIPIQTNMMVNPGIVIR